MKNKLFSGFLGWAASRRQRINQKTVVFIVFLNVNLTIDQKVEFLSISPKSFSLKESVNGKGVVVAKEFLGDYYIYKVKISDINLRVRTNINQNVKTGKRCDLSLIKGSQVFLFPGGYKRNVA